MTAARRGVCPGCGGLLAINARPHCYAAYCTWVRCSCQTVVDTTHPERHYPARKAAA